MFPCVPTLDRLQREKKGGKDDDEDAADWREIRIGPVAEVTGARAVACEDIVCSRSPDALLVVGAFVGDVAAASHDARYPVH